MSYDFAVIGRGLWGSAAAMHLAREGHSVALIGPSEPAVPQTSNGPFASHYDAGRITRSIAVNLVWARASARSIARYAALSEESGIEFYTACGGMMASDDPSYANAVEDIAHAEGYAHDRLSGEALATRFPEFTFDPGTRAIWDATGGHIDPRAMRRAHEALAQMSGAAVFDDVAIGLDGGSVTLANGPRIDAGHVVLANGSYAKLSGLMPDPLDIVVCARTVFFAEVSEVEAARLSNMPSLVWKPAATDHYYYLLQPIRYPDGRILVKIGGENNNITVSTEAEARDWMRGIGNAGVGADLEAALRALMPGLEIRGTSQAACILGHSTTGVPYIGRVSDKLTVATACCGSGAKSADELGRIAARAALGDSDAPHELGADLTPLFA